MANYETAVCATLVAYFLEKYSSGRRGAPAKGVGRVTGAEVQIFSSPPKKRQVSTCRFLSKPQAWHGITLCVYGIAEGAWHHALRVWNCRRRMASRFACMELPKAHGITVDVSFCGLIPSNPLC